jgi:lauroyl/myristoyl acyltransferase
VNKKREKTWSVPYLLLSPDRASASGRWLLRMAGPHLDKTHIFRRNLSLAFPDKSTAEIDHPGAAGAAL